MHLLTGTRTGRRFGSALYLSVMIPTPSAAAFAVSAHARKRQPSPPLHRPHPPPSAFVFAQISFTSPSFFHWLFSPSFESRYLLVITPPSLPPSFHLLLLLLVWLCRVSCVPLPPSLASKPHNARSLEILLALARTLLRAFRPPRVCTSATTHKSTFCRCVRLRPF